MVIHRSLAANVWGFVAHAFSRASLDAALKGAAKTSCAGLKAAATLALAASALLAANVARAGDPPYFAIRKARIVPVSGPVIENGTVVMANGLIAAVGTDVPIPPEAWVIDGKGLTVYPGLIDALTDLGLLAAPAAPPGAPTVAAPVAPQRLSRGPEDRPATTPWHNAADDIKPDDKRLETWRNAGFTSALTASKSGIFPGQGAVINLAGARPGEPVVKAPAALEVNFQPVGGFFSFPGSLMGVLAYVKQVFLDAAWDAQAQPIYDAHPQGLERPAYDRTERAIDDVLRSQQPVLLPGNTSPQIVRALALGQQLSLRTILYGGQQGYAVAETIAAKKVPVLVSLKWPEKEKDADPEAEEPLRVLRFRDRAPSTPVTLEKAGVKFAFYSGGMANPKDILKSARKAIDAGLKPEAALRAFTLNAAEILGVADRLGSIEPGKIANLAITDGDLFNEKTKVKMVFVDGCKYEVREPSRPTEPPTVNLTGKWTLTINTPQGAQPATADLTMAADGTLSGSVTSQLGTASISSGWVSGNRFSFTISLTMGPTPTDATFSGTVEGNHMTGTVGIGQMAIDFSGTRPGGSHEAAADERN